MKKRHYLTATICFLCVLQAYAVEFDVHARLKPISYFGPEDGASLLFNNTVFIAIDSSQMGLYNKEPLPETTCAYIIDDNGAETLYFTFPSETKDLLTMVIFANSTQKRVTLTVDDNRKYPADTDYCELQALAVWNY